MPKSPQRSHRSLGPNDGTAASSGYRGHNASPEYQFKVYTAGQKRRTTPQIKRDMKRRAAVEPVIGHLKEDHRMGRNYLAHSSGDAFNAVLAAVEYRSATLFVLPRLNALTCSATDMALVCCKLLILASNPI